MLAVVMCGGKGRRIGNLEKPMLRVKGKILIEYAIQELEIACLDAIFVTSKHTPKTYEFLKERGYEVFMAMGEGYMKDLRYAVEEYGLIEPILTINSDLYFRREGILLGIIDFYFKTDSPALCCIYRGGRAVGINVFDPFHELQREENFIIDEDDVVNIDTFQDLRRARYGEL